MLLINLEKVKRVSRNFPESSIKRGPKGLQEDSGDFRFLFMAYLGVSGLRGVLSYISRTSNTVSGSSRGFQERFKDVQKDFRGV